MARKRKADSEDSKDNAAKDDGFSLDPLRDKIEKSRQLADWMSAALEHRSEFPAEVVVTVLSDYLDQYDEVVVELKDAATAASGHRKELAEKASTLEDAEKELAAAIDELKLRHVIGELDKKAFEKAEKDVRAKAETTELPEIRSAMEEIDGALADVGSVQARIADIRSQYESLTGTQKAVSDEEVASAAAPPADDELGDAAYEAGGPPGGEEWEVGTAGSPAIGAEEKDAAETSNDSELMATGVINARPDIESMEEPPKAAEQIKPAEEPEGEGPRLLVIPPDAPESVVPFTGEVMSMGRGRNNDIQIKNDGKISRYHCRIFRRGDEFIIEDNKSSNGTLVNGKLVTRQRLDGGEQVQIGETRMTFFL